MLSPSGRNEKEVVKQAISTALEDRRVIVSVSFPDAIDTLMWLVESPAFDAPQVAQVLLCVISDYGGLVRNCPSCFEPQPPTIEQTDLLREHGFDIGEANFGHSRGCRECDQVGFKQPWHRISEAFFIDNTLADLLRQKPSRKIIEEMLRKNGWKSRFEQTMVYAMRGEAPLEEALRVGLARRADM